MQLLLLLALLLYGGNNNAGGPLKQFRPLLEKFGGDEVKQALKSADELEEIISAFGNLSAGGEKKQDAPAYAAAGDGALRAEAGTDGSAGEGEGPAGEQAAQSARSAGDGRAHGPDFALDPVAGIADGEIIYRLARCFYGDHA